MLLLEVLEKLWNLILDFKGAWKALEKKNFCWKCLKIMKTPWIFVWMGNNVGWYQSYSGIERRFQNRGQIISGEAFLKLIFMTNENILKQCKTKKPGFEYSLKTQFLVSKNQHRLWLNSCEHRVETVNLHLSGTVANRAGTLNFPKYEATRRLGVVPDGISVVVKASPRNLLTKIQSVCL